MGGINHQPCSKYLEISTLLSRSLSEGRLSLELVNISLEDILLYEIREKTSSPNFSALFENLNNAKKSVKAIIGGIQALRAQMNSLEFQNLSSLNEISLSELGEKMSEESMVCINIWNQIIPIFKMYGFFGVLDEFETIAQDIQTKTENLDVCFKSIPEGVKIYSILEENREGNIKKEFAQLYHAWNFFQEKFLVSSMISTNIWYHYQGIPMMVEVEKESLV